MRQKILTVDDSRTIRTIVRKAFKLFACDILEATNGVEGLAVASRENPDLILLDVTMPVMDGVEMLTRLKADPVLRNVPVLMLTAEGGRDNVLKIAKMGVRDYIVKPFKEELLLEKCGRVIDLKRLTDGPVKIKSIFDPADILVVEDKPAIVQQIREGLRHTPWKILGMATQGEAIDHCTRTPPDLVLVSLSLPDEAAFGLFRLLRTNVKTKHAPIFALTVKTETAQQQQAQAVGFSTIITKPIDCIELESKIAKALNLDTSLRYYSVEQGILIMRLPESCTSAVLGEAANYLKPKFAEAIDAGVSRLVIDIHAVPTLQMGVIKLLFQAMQTARELAMHFALVGNEKIIAECKGFEDTSNWKFYDSLETAKSQVGIPAAAPAPEPALAG